MGKRENKIMLEKNKVVERTQNLDKPKIAGANPEKESKHLKFKAFEVLKELQVKGNEKISKAEQEGEAAIKEGVDEEAGKDIKKDIEDAEGIKNQADSKAKDILDDFGAKISDITDIPGETGNKTINPSESRDRLPQKDAEQIVNFTSYPRSTREEFDAVNKRIKIALDELNRRKNLLPQKKQKQAKEFISIVFLLKDKSLATLKNRADELESLIETYFNIDDEIIEKDKSVKDAKAENTAEEEMRETGEEQGGKLEAEGYGEPGTHEWYDQAEFNSADDAAAAAETAGKSAEAEYEGLSLEELY